MRCVRGGDHVRLGGEALDRRDRAEDLVAHAFGVVGHVDQYRRFVEEPDIVRRALAPCHHRRPSRHRVIDHPLDLLERRRVHQRPDRDALVEAVAHLERSHRGGEPAGECVMHRVVDVEAVRRGAGLAHVAHLGGHRAVDRRVEIGVVEDDEGCVAAQFHARIDDAVGGLAQRRGHVATAHSMRAGRRRPRPSPPRRRRACRPPPKR